MKIESGGATGYVSAEYVTTGEKARKLALSSMKYMAEILTDSVDALYEPKEGADVITTFLKGERYDINGETKDWVEIEAVTELSGYVKEKQFTQDISLMKQFTSHLMVYQKLDRILFEKHLNIMAALTSGEASS